MRKNGSLLTDGIKMYWLCQSPGKTDIIENADKINNLRHGGVGIR